jgi:hypothetical protein
VFLCHFSNVLLVMITRRVEEFIALACHPLSQRRALVAVDHGTLKCGLAITSSLKSEPKRLLTVRVSSGTPLGENLMQRVSTMKSVDVHVRPCSCCALAFFR